MEARRAHNPEVVGSSPTSATKSVTVVDTISATVIFCFPVLLGAYRIKMGVFRTFPAIGAMCARICCGHDEKTLGLAKRQSL